MAIDINGLNGSPASGAQQNTQVTRQERPDRDDRSSKTQQNPDSVTLTESAKLLQNLEKTLEDQPIVDKQRVEQARQNINSGNYQINSDVISSRLVQHELLLSA
jgi:flagellar biosynthesis anti-sigma factor FlgM